MRSSALISATEQAWRFTLLAQPGCQQILVLRAGAGTYGLPFSKVAEVRALTEALPVLHPPDYERGAVLRHGVLTPVIDLRVYFGAPGALDENTRLVFCWSSHRDVSIGLLVDKVIDLLAVEGREFQPPADFAPRPDGRYVLATHGTGERTVLILDPDYLAL